MGRGVPDHTSGFLGRSARGCCGNPYGLCLIYRICLVIAPILVVSCAQNPTLRGRLPNPPKFTLQAGDEIEVRFTYFPELSDTQEIRPDGKISLPLVDDVLVADLTPEEVDFLLTNIYADKIKEPEITVIVRSLANQRIFMGGEALLPGAIDYRPGMTVMDALMEAGGWVRDTAAPNQVVIFRMDKETGVRAGTTIDVQKEVTSSYSKPFQLAANDIIYIPETDVSKANRWIEQNLNNMVPGLGVSVSESRGKSGVGVGF